MNVQGRDLRRDLRGDDVALLHRELAIIGLTVPDAERDQALFGQGTFDTVVHFQKTHGYEPTGVVDAETARAINAAVNALTFNVEGKAVSRKRVGVGGLRVTIVDKNVGDDVRLAEAVTDADGSYKAHFVATNFEQRGKDRPDLQARVFAGETFLGASDVRYNATNRETLNVLLPEKADSSLPSEHETLVGSLAAHFRGNLRDLKETDDRQDITYLANKTGWDARAVALAALSDQFSQQTADTAGTAPIKSPFFYALFRAGLSTNADTLYQTDAGTVGRVWKQAIEQGVIPKSLTQDIPTVTKQFQTLGAQKLLSSPALIGASSLKEMLTASHLGEVQQIKFAELYAAHRTDMVGFWNAAGDAFGKDTANRLQVDGKLAFLTINNATLMQSVHNAVGDNGLSDPVQLAQLGYHRAEAWRPLLTAGVPVPKEIPGDTPEVKRANYAEYLAAQVRLSYPTAAVAQLVKSGDLPVEVPDHVHAFLTANQGKFEIGVQPVQQYIARNNLTVDNETVKQIKRLQRVYQITPNDQAMTGLMKRGIDAAYHVVRYERQAFVKSFARNLGGEDSARQTYDKSVQVHNTVLNVAVSYLTARTAPGIGVHSDPSIVAPTPSNPGDVIAYATLESLFGSMDFCACDHCRSILSPAAYLVDLLLFLHSDEQEWKDFCTTWKSEHDGAPYPFTDQESWDDAQNPNDTEISPLDILLSRRPDIQHLPLTCENTNTALPYIDVVNEMLEYFIANAVQQLSLNDYVGHDTGSATSTDLLASPQFVMDEAYTTLRGERFPTPLPFHQPLESLRRYFNKFEVPLPLAMERLRESDDLERGANAYGWRDILMEELMLSRDEYEILTDSPNSVPLWSTYGFPSGTTDVNVIGGIPNLAGLSKAKQFTRRVGITYEELVAILKTRFINPNSDLIPKLKRLGVPFVPLKALKDGQASDGTAFSDTDFIALLPAGAGALDPADYGGNIAAWVKDDTNYAHIMGLITLTLPVAPWTASKNYSLFDCVTPTAPPAGFTHYYACTTAGTSGASEPNPWPTTPGTTFTDGTATWTYRDGSTDCNFDDLAFRYADPGKLTQNITAVEFVRLLRFIRLWKKMGWTIEQTDAAICALYKADMSPLSADDMDSVAKLDTGFLTLLPRLGIIVRVMNKVNLKPKRDLVSLLACWSEIGTHGDSALYRQMFLNSAVLHQDPVFADNGYGEFLHRASVPYSHPQPALEQPIRDAAQGRISYDNSSKHLSYAGILEILTRDALKAVAGVSAAFQEAVDALYATQRLVTHSEALRSAFNLTGDEYDLVAATLGYDANTPLTIPNVSAIFRRGWLARKLKLSVRELTLFIQLTGLDPFAAPDPTNPAILRLIALVQALKDRSLKSAAALYLIWNQDLSGKSTPDSAQVTDFARTLRGDYADIENQFAATEDPGGDIARARMALVYGQEIADAFFELLDNTLVLDEAYTHQTPTLEIEITTTDSGIAYDDFRHRLSHTGVLNEATREDLKSIPGVTAAFKAAVGALFARSEDAKGSFFTRYRELEPLYDNMLALDQTLVLDVNYTHSALTLESAITAADSKIAYDNINHRLSYSGVLTAARRDKLKSVADVSLAFQAAIDALFAGSQDAKGAVLGALRPELARRRKLQQALQRLSAAAATDLPFTQSILNPDVPLGAPYPLHAAGHNDQPALNDVLALETPGLSVQFFANDTATGASIPSAPIAANLDYAPAVGGLGNPLPTNPTPGAAISGIWHGRLEIPEAGFYNIVIEADIGANVTLSLGGQARPLTQNANVWRNSDPLELKAGTLYEIALTVEKVKDALSVKWETPKRAREAVAGRYLYPPTILAPFDDAYTRFLKVVSLAVGLGLTANEVAHFATDPDYQIAGNGWLNALPVSGEPDTATAAALAKPFQGLLDFARIKAAVSPGDERLLTALKDPVAATATTDSLLYTLTRWDAASLTTLLNLFSSTGTGDVSDLSHLELFRRVYDAFALIQVMGISAKALTLATANEPTGDTVRYFQGALRARYEAADWREVVQPINDEMRSLQRDALVAYILHQMRSDPASAHIDNADKLFEYFLMDVQIDPCMQTSRIRHALSSVQLFIERSLMNLERRVSPASINAKQWEWMKRYRVWEANRKVYLRPENWLEPELRDDKSPFFKEIESELLQSDITEDSAATALLNYLSKLEEVAKLEPCGIYHVEANLGLRTTEIDHVVARTAGAHRKYYYRRYEYGYWTPWEQIKLDIEDNPVIPVVWNDRLLLFWLRILKQTPLSTQAMKTSSNTTDTLAGLSLAGIQTDAKTNAQSNAKVTVQAVLCWSEYYNGKWQATKTSDVSVPTELGPFDPTGESAFHRWLWLSVAEEADALRVSIFGEASSSFLLYNTHSVPLREEDAPVPPQHLVFAKSRKHRPTISMSLNHRPLIFDYKQWIPNATLPRRVLTDGSRGYSFVEPRHSLQGAWGAPFFYSDSRHVFFVTTTELPVPISSYQGYAIAVNVGIEQAVDIPSLVLQLDPHAQLGPKFWDDGEPGPDSGIIDPAPMQRFITEDAYIRQGVGTSIGVMYGDKQIGPSGAISPGQAGM